jgi:2-oxoglutarate ferredoxin oxidoreductase subunit beta
MSNIPVQSKEGGPAKPGGGAKPPATNRLGLQMAVYKGLESTLCAGCGHDSITNALIKSLYEYGVEPHKVAKLSGIGCSSKTTAYFLGKSHGFNAVHGRMAAIDVGVNLANHTLLNVGVSGDGDTASIGLSHYLHMVRRNAQCVYIIENNGCYGLTKGQFSATADMGSAAKGGSVNHMPPIDCCALAIEMGCSYVGRSFSGDGKQMVALLKGAIAHKGTSVLDIVSPCVTFNNHEGSTKSYPYAKEHEDQLHELGFVPFYEAVTVDYDPGTTTMVELQDGSKITLKKLGHDYDPANRTQALDLLHKASVEQLFLTGLIYYNKQSIPMDVQMNLIPEALATLPADRLRPSPEALKKVLSRYT